MQPTIKSQAVTLQEWSNGTGKPFCTISTTGFHNGPDPALDFVRIWIINVQLKNGTWRQYETRDARIPKRIKQLCIYHGQGLYQFRNWRQS